MKSQPLPCTGAILAGGSARRFGSRAKGLEKVGGERILDRVACQLCRAADDLLLIANDDAARGWLPGVRVEGDVLPGRGALGGIHAALVHASHGVLAVAWDMPFVSAELLLALRERADATGADVVAPESGSRREVEPLCAYYSPACIAPIETRLAAGDWKVSDLHQNVRLERLTIEQVRQLGDPEVLFMNVNSPQDLERAASMARNRTRTMPNITE